MTMANQLPTNEHRRVGRLSEAIHLCRPASVFAAGRAPDRRHHRPIVDTYRLSPTAVTRPAWRHLDRYGAEDLGASRALCGVPHHRASDAVRVPATRLRPPAAIRQGLPMTRHPLLRPALPQCRRWLVQDAPTPPRPRDRRQTIVSQPPFVDGRTHLGVRQFRS